MFAYDDLPFIPYLIIFNHSKEPVTLSRDSRAGQRAIHSRPLFKEVFGFLAQKYQSFCVITTEVGTTQIPGLRANVCFLWPATNSC